MNSILKILVISTFPLAVLAQQIPHPMPQSNIQSKESVTTERKGALQPAGTAVRAERLNTSVNGDGPIAFTANGKQIVGDIHVRNEKNFRETTHNNRQENFNALDQDKGTLDVGSEKLLSTAASNTKVEGAVDVKLGEDSTKIKAAVKQEYIATQQMNIGKSNSNAMNSESEIK